MAHVLLILKLIVSIPSRVIAGMLVDKPRPKLMFSTILIKCRFTGQTAGIAGAYGNGCEVILLTVLSFYDPQILCLTIRSTTGVVLLMLKEPKGQMTEVMEDGLVQMVSVEK